MLLSDISELTYPNVRLGALEGEMIFAERTSEFLPLPEVATSCR